MPVPVPGGRTRAGARAASRSWRRKRENVVRDALGALVSSQVVGIVAVLQLLSLSLSWGPCIISCWGMQKICERCK